MPQIGEIVDVTDHAAGSNPFYSLGDGNSPILNRPIPAGVIVLENGQVTVEPEYLAPRLGLTPETLREGLHSGAVVGVTETGQDADAGKTRIVLRSGSRAWAAEIDADGAAREIPPPRVIEAAADKEQSLPQRVRAYLEALPPGETTITYGAPRARSGAVDAGLGRKGHRRAGDHDARGCRRRSAFPCGARGQPRADHVAREGLFSTLRAPSTVDRKRAKPRGTFTRES